MGGFSPDGYKRFSDVLVFDHWQHSIKKVVHDSKVQFNAAGNQTSRLAGGDVCALVSNASHKPCIVHFKRAQGSLKELPI